MNAQDLLSEAIKQKERMDEDYLAHTDPDGYDLNVNGIRRINVKYDEGEHMIFTVTPWGLITKYDRNILDG